jgi:hypothetical protein
MSIQNKMLCKAFLIGSSVPVFLVPLIGYWSFAKIANPETAYSLVTVPISYPIIIGILNVFFLMLRESIPLKKDTHKYLAFGLVVGLILSLIGKFVFDFPTLQLELPEHLQFVVHIFAPIVYALVFRFIIKPLNEMLYIR